jgi:hypothetical protein
MLFPDSQTCINKIDDFNNSIIQNRTVRDKQGGIKGVKVQREL